MGLLVALLVIAITYFWFLAKTHPKTKSLDLTLLPPQFVVVDTETTGLDPSRHEIIEIGAIKVNRDSNVHTTFQTFVKPVRKLPKQITEITSITPEMLALHGAPLEKAITEFLQFAGDLRLVAFNAEFDIAFLSKAAARFDKKIKNPVSCALKMSRRAWPGRKSYSLANLSHDGGMSTSGNHRALKDCELTMTVYAAAVAKLKRLQ